MILKHCKSLSLTAHLHHHLHLREDPMAPPAQSAHSQGSPLWAAHHPPAQQERPVSGCPLRGRNQAQGVGIKLELATHSGIREYKGSYTFQNCGGLEPGTLAALCSQTHSGSTRQRFEGGLWQGRARPTHRILQHVGYTPYVSPGIRGLRLNINPGRPDALWQCATAPIRPLAMTGSL